MKRHLITAALPYANGVIHLGHFAGAYLPADIYNRYLQLMGGDTLFVSGSDEHGAAITIQAKKEGVTPQEIVDKYHALNKQAFENMSVDFDYYGRTSDPLHHETATKFLQKLLVKFSDLAEMSGKQYYDEQEGMFLPDRYVYGTCPKCEYDTANSDQCELCGSTFEPGALISPKSALNDSTPILKETNHLYFRLDRHQAWLREWIESQTTWRNHVKGQCLSWLDTEGGLKPRCITRDLDWGIQVPIEAMKDKVLYVWFDAPIGYITNTIEACKHKQADLVWEDWEDWWTDSDEDLEVTHFIGKDNILFHCIMFPAMLKAHGGYALPTNVPANQFLNYEGKKFSKSAGWGIDVNEYLSLFSEHPLAADLMRWTLVRNMPENKDADFTWDSFVESCDLELANKIGNYVMRVVTLANRYCDNKGAGRGEVPDRVIDRLNEYKTLMSSFRFKESSDVIVQIASIGNEMLQAQQPWDVAKDPTREYELTSVIMSHVQICVILSTIMIPFTPKIAALMSTQLDDEGSSSGSDLWSLYECIEAKVPLYGDDWSIANISPLIEKVYDKGKSRFAPIIDAQRPKT